MVLGVAGREGKNPTGQRASGAMLPVAKEPLVAFRTCPGGRECSSFAGEGQEAGSKSVATARRGNPRSGALAPARAAGGGGGASQGVPG